MFKRGVFFIVILLVFVSLGFFAYGVVDSDKDGLPNDYELANGLDYLRSNLNLDSDRDGLLDLDEYKFNSSPMNKDTDNDGYSDKEEFDKGFDPNNKFSPKYIIITKIAIPSFLIMIIIIITLFISHLIKSSNKKTPKTESEVNTPKPKKSIFRFLSAFSELLLGPSISKARERDRQLEKEKIKGIENIYLDSTKILKKLDLGNDFETRFDKKNDNKQVVFTPSNDAFDFQLKRVLRNNIRKNKVSDILGYFDKKMDTEELTLLEEKKSKKEINEWYNKRKNMRNKIIDLANEEKEQLVKSNPVNRKDDDLPKIFDRLDEINNNNNN